MNPLGPGAPSFERVRLGRPARDTDIDRLLGNDLFRGVRPELAVLAARAFRIANLPARALVYERWQLSTTVFLVLSGQIDLERDGPLSVPLELASIGPGSFFGENAFFTGFSRVHRMDARCALASTISFADAADLEPMFAAGSAIALNLARTLAGRVDTLVERITKAAPFASDGSGFPRFPRFPS